MADTVDTVVTENGNRNYHVRLTNKSDGTGESAVTKVDASTLTGPEGKPGLAVDHFAVKFIEWSIQGFSSVELFFDADTDDELAKLSGNGERYFDPVLTDPTSTGYTGDIKLTTNGAVNGATYDILLHLKKKQA